MAVRENFRGKRAFPLRWAKLKADLDPGNVRYTGGGYCGHARDQDTKEGFTG
jgi:hypothetical protein